MKEINKHAKMVKCMRLVISTAFVSNLMAVPVQATSSEFVKATASETAIFKVKGNPLTPLHIAMTYRGKQCGAEMAGRWRIDSYPVLLGRTLADVREPRVFVKVEKMICDGQVLKGASGWLIDKDGHPGLRDTCTGDNPDRCSKTVEAGTDLILNVIRD